LGYAYINWLCNERNIEHSILFTQKLIKKDLLLINQIKCNYICKKKKKENGKIKSKTPISQWVLRQFSDRGYSLTLNEEGLTLLGNNHEDPYYGVVGL
jgi:hypothetical protein